MLDKCIYQYKWQAAQNENKIFSISQGSIEKNMNNMNEYVG